MEKTNFEQHREERLKDPDFRKKYDALIPKYKLIRSLIKRRNELRLSQVQLASIIGKQQSAISRLERGTGSISMGTLFSVADALDLDVDIIPRKRVKC
jgi:predicted transcriptional regulator